MTRQQLTNAIFREIAIVQEGVDTILKENLPASLPPAQFKLLNHLIFTTNTDETASDLARNMRVTLSAMSQMIKQLVGKGYMAVSISADDARKKTLLITPQGHAAHSEVMIGINNTQQSFIQKFSQNELAELFESLNHYRLIFE